MTLTLALATVLAIAAAVALGRAWWYTRAEVAYLTDECEQHRIAQQAAEADLARQIAGFRVAADLYASDTTPLDNPDEPVGEVRTYTIGRVAP